MPDATTTIQVLVFENEDEDKVLIEAMKWLTDHAIENFGAYDGEQLLLDRPGLKASVTLQINLEARGINGRKN